MDQSENSQMVGEKSRGRIIMDLSCHKQLTNYPIQSYMYITDIDVKYILLFITY